MDHCQSSCYISRQAAKACIQDVASSGAGRLDSDGRSRRPLHTLSEPTLLPQSSESFRLLSSRPPNGQCRSRTRPGAQRQHRTARCDYVAINRWLLIAAVGVMDRCVCGPVACGRARPGALTPATTARASAEGWSGAVGWHEFLLCWLRFERLGVKGTRPRVMAEPLCLGAFWARSGESAAHHLAAASEYGHARELKGGVAGNAVLQGHRPCAGLHQDGSSTTALHTTPCPGQPSRGDGPVKPCPPLLPSTASASY